VSALSLEDQLHADPCNMAAEILLEKVSTAQTNSILLEEHIYLIGPGPYAT
jgi:hypothetical protein